MADIRLSDLFKRLNEPGERSIQNAWRFCQDRGNPTVELEHWVHQILQEESDSDLHRILRYFNLDLARLGTDLIASLDSFPRGASSVSGFSTSLSKTVERGWLYASLKFNQAKIRSGHVLVGLLKTPELQMVTQRMSKDIASISADELIDRFAKIVEGSPEDQWAGEASVVTAADRDTAAAARGDVQPALNKFAHDLTERAREGKIDPIIGRDAEIRQIVDILLRRRQNNPILTGEAGVGKTAVVEGFARRVAGGDVPPPLRNVSVKTLDLGLLQAGTSMRGEFEKRLQQVIEEVQASEKPIILFIDEAHQMIGAGAAEGQGDAANLLKPALARGELRTIAATTWAEYKEYFEKDAALTRRFQVVKVDEPDEAKALDMIRGLGSRLSAHHGVQILDEAFAAAVRLSSRYIPARQLPDKAVSLIDTACARVSLTQHATPAALEDCQRRIEVLETEKAILQNEADMGAERKQVLAELEAALAERRAEKERMTAAWEKEKALIDEVLALRSELLQEAGASRAGVEGNEGEAEAAEEGASAQSPGDGKTREDRLEALHRLEQNLAELQGERPLVHPSVDANAVAAVVSDWTGVPVGRMVRSEIETILKLADHLERRVIGQRHALEQVAERLQASRASVDDPRKPIGVFLFAGSSGVGKTETALALAEALYGGEGNLITINMSEFKEEHKVATLIGAPPGYKGYGKGGILTEAVRRRPYSVVLLDEIEKAHRTVHEIFFQVFDKGMMDDSEGRRVDFKNTILIITTNIGTELITGLCKDPDTVPDADALAKAVRTPLLKHFDAAFLGRLKIVPYYPLSDEVLRQIIDLQLSRIARRLKENRHIELSYDEAVRELIASRCDEVESGARVVDAILTQTMLPELSRRLLTALLENREIKKASIGVENEAFTYALS